MVFLSGRVWQWSIVLTRRIYHQRKLSNTMDFKTSSREKFRRRRKHCFNYKANPLILNPLSDTFVKKVSGRLFGSWFDGTLDRIVSIKNLFPSVRKLTIAGLSLSPWR